MSQPRHSREGGGPTLTLNLRRWLRCAAGLVLLAGEAFGQARVTSLDGDLIAGGRPLSLHSTLPAGELAELAEGARSSLLIGDGTLIQLCDGAVLRIVAGAGSRADQIELRQGMLSATVVGGAGRASLEIRTPNASIALLGRRAQVTLSEDARGATVSSLEGRVQVTPASGGEGRLLDTHHQLVVTSEGELGGARRFEPDQLSLSSACLQAEAQRANSVAISSQILATAPPSVSANAGDAPSLASDLAQIVALDIPEDGLPLEDAASPSALITELNKAGLDEEVCDPITCNPVNQLPTPEPCGDPPVTGCIPIP